MPPRGGLADKIGNRYEGRIAVRRILQLLDEQHDSVRIRFEQPGDDSFEWWVQRRDGSRVYTQVKRQQSVDDEWTIGTLVSRGVIPAFGQRLGEDPAAHCEFFSALSASHLLQMSEDARMAASLVEFETQFVAAKSKKESWETLCRAWPDASRDEAWRRLQRVTAGNIDEQTLRETLRAHAQALVDAPPDEVIARLGEFLGDHLSVELTAHDVWGFLRETCGFRATDWSRDQSIQARIHDETTRYRAGITADRASLTEIRRSAAGVIAELLATPDGPAVVTVAADAGVGKTALLGQVLDDLQASASAAPGDHCPQVVLATRLDRLDGFRDAHELGVAMRLPGSPAAVLSRVAAGRPALLVLDQVDAFGTGSGRNPARLEAVTEALRDARALGIKVMIACRTFDLEMDDRLAVLAGTARKGQHADGHHVEFLGPLPDRDVDDALRVAGIEPTGLTGSLRMLLSTPLHLHMLVVLYERGQLDTAGITTRLQLFDKFYAAVREEAEGRQQSAPVTEVSDRLAVMLSERQELSVAAARLGDHPTTVENLVRAGWLRRDRGRIAFAHEAFFDYAYAQQHMRSGLPLLSLLRSGEQHLFRRAQVRQILALEREQERDQYLRDVREILAAADVRPHLKELVVALVTLVPDPSFDEWETLGVLGDATADSLAERACWLAAQAPGFSQLLLDKGIIGRYLSDPGTADLGTWMCTLLIRNHPDQVAALLYPYVGQDGWSGPLVRVLNVAPLDRSEQAVSLMIAVIDAGGLDAAVRGPGPSSGDFFSLLHGIRGQSAASGARLVAAWLRRRLALLIDDGAYSPSSGLADSELDQAADDPGTSGTDEDGTDEERVAVFIEALHAAQYRRLLSDSMSAPEILATLATDNAVAFTRNILPVVRQASAASRTGQVSMNGERDEAFGIPPSREPGHDPTEALLIRLAQAVQAAAGSGDPDTHAAIRDMADSVLATEQLLAAAGFASGHPDLLSDAATWLQDGPHALDQGWLDDGREMSAQIITQVCTQLPAEQTRGIQERAATHTSDFEKYRRDLYGSAAWRLLRDIPEGNLTDEAGARKSELSRKFSRPAAATPAMASGVMDISFCSPIDIAAVRRMSDDHLVNAMRRWSADEWQPEPSGRLRGGATTFAQVIGTAAQEDPHRFTAVLESLPGDINPAYMTYILLGLSRTATPEQSLRAARAARKHTATSGMQIGQLIERAAPHLDAALLTAAGLTEDELLELFGQLLAQPPAPAVPDDTAASGRSDAGPSGDSDENPVQAPAAPEITGQKIAEQLMFRAWNRPEYAALRALAILAPSSPQAAALLDRQLHGLAGSPDLAVRALAIEMSLTQITDNPGALTAIVATALDSDGVAGDTEREPLSADPRILLASHQLRDLLLRLCWSRYDLAAPVLTRMISFYDTTVAEAGAAAELMAAASQAAHNAAMIAAVAACKNPEPLALTRELAVRQLPFRRGISAALARILPLGEVPDELVAVLIQFFDDADDDIARLAGSVIVHLPAGHDDLARRVLFAACQAKTFTLAPSPVITAAEHYRGDISGSVVEIAERFFQLHGSQAADLRGHGGHDANVLGRLVIAIYAEVTQDPQLASRALDLIDAMVLARTYGLEEHLAKLDR
jgi:hypothetical protein